MSFDLKQWLAILTDKITAEFGKRVLFIGLQGSYFRGEATEQSDIDIIVILEELSFKDLKAYREIIKSMDQSEKACGFICGKGEIEAWPKQDIFHLIYDSEALYGDITKIIKKPSEEDIRNNIRTEAADLYHEVCHRYLYSGDLPQMVEKLKHAYKTAFFITQEMVFLNKKQYIKTKQEMLSFFDKGTRDILYIAIMWDHLQQDREIRSECYYMWLIEWSSKVLKHYNSYYRWSLAK